MINFTLEFLGLCSFWSSDRKAYIEWVYSTGVEKIAVRTADLRQALFVSCGRARVARGFGFAVLWQRQDGSLEVIESIEDWVSPRLGIWFVVTPETWEIYRPDGSRFLTDVELGQRLEEPQQQLQTAQAKADRLADRLCTLGIDPSEV